MTLEQKLSKIRHHQDFKKVDGMLITKPENILYLLGFKIESESLLFVPNTEKKKSDEKIVLFLTPLEYDQARNKVETDKELVKGVNLRLIPPGNLRFVEKTIKKMGLKKVGFEEDHVTYKKYIDWKEKFKIDEFVGLSDVISSARMQKTSEEIERIKKAAQMSDIGFETIFNVIKEGMTEKELAAEAEYEMRKAGSGGTSFDTIVASGEKTMYPHASTGDRKIEDGDLILVDIGAIYRGYCSDMSRTFIFGTKDKEKQALIRLVNEGQQFALDFVRDGIKCSELDKKTREFFINKHSEWGSRFIHSLGHGVGVEVHERPHLSLISQDTLEEGMILTIEPGLYIPGLGGARTEDLIKVKKDGFSSLTQSEKWHC
ncbi:MAG: M24 family metallopeptidase [Promethearchaeota archaeon]